VFSVRTWSSLHYTWVVSSELGIQYLRTSISEEQRAEFGRLVGATIGQIEAARFPSHSGIRFPQNSCVSCAHLGLCLDDQKLIDFSLTLTPGASDLAWLDELVD